MGTTESERLITESIERTVYEEVLEQTEPGRRFVRLMFKALCERCYWIADGKGFWEGGRNDGEAIALMHSELSEALEGLRDGNPESEKLGNPFSQVEEELADCVIRMLDLCGGRDWDVGGALVAKMAVNEGRAYKHGRKF